MLFFTTQAAVDAWSSCYSVIDGNLTVIGANVDSLDNLEGLKEVTGNVFIQATGLEDMKGLDSLKVIGGSLSMLQNSTLATLDGLDSLSSVGLSLTIYYNFQLSDCCAIYELLDSGGVGATVTIFFNVVGCNSEPEILLCPPPAPLISIGTNGQSVPACDDCGVGKIAEILDVQLFPNPATHQVDIRLNGRLEESSSVALYNLAGKKLLEQKMEAGQIMLSIDLSQHKIDNGGYLVTIKTSTQMISKKLIVIR